MIPNIFHFVFLTDEVGGKPFTFSYYLAIKSAHDLNKPEKIFFHCRYVPTGHWWEQVAPLVEVNKVVPPSHIHGNTLHHPAHQADVIRLRMLQEMGGVYLDLDTICVKPLSVFFNEKFVIGEEAALPAHYTLSQKVKKAITTQSLKPFFHPPAGLCNAVILSEKGSDFIKIWLESYKTFRSKGPDEFWGEHSVRMPLKLSREHPDKLRVLNYKTFHFPLYDDYGIKSLFEQNVKYKSAYVHHVWESASRPYLARLTPEYIKTVDTTYNLIARKFLN